MLKMPKFGKWSVMLHLPDSRDAYILFKSKVAITANTQSGSSAQANADFAGTFVLSTKDLVLATHALPYQLTDTKKKRCYSEHMKTEDEVR